MSVKIMGLVWELRLPSAEKLVLLAYADHADHEGHNIWPSVDLISKKTGYSRRHVQRTTRKLQADGYLVEHQKGGGTGRTTRWRIPPDKLKPSDQKGDTLSPFEDATVTPTTGKVTSTTPKGDTLSPEPSLTTNNRPRVEEGDTGLRKFLQMNMGPHAHLLHRATAFVAADTGDLNIYPPNPSQRERLLRPAVHEMIEEAMEGYLGYSGKVVLW